MTLTRDDFPAEYFAIRIQVDGAEIHWPQAFAIISGYATTGETWSDERNQTADQVLLTALRARSRWWKRVVVCSLDGSHREPSWAVELPWETACDLGRDFRQWAIYYVVGDELSVSYCDPRRQLVTVGSFRESLGASST
jgi:hypothetical protein